MKAMKNIQKYTLFLVLIGISMIVMINLYPVKEGLSFKEYVERAHEALPEHDINDRHDNLIRVETVQLDDSEEIDKIDEDDEIEIQVGDYKTFVENTTETQLPSSAEAEIPVNNHEWLDELAFRRGGKTWWGRRHSRDWH